MQVAPSNSEFLFLMYQYAERKELPRPKPKRGRPRVHYCMIDVPTRGPSTSKKLCQACLIKKSRSEFRRYFDGKKNRYRPRCKTCEKNRTLINRSH